MLMRQRQLNPVRLSLIAAVLSIAGGALAASCNKVDPNAERSEYIRVYDSLADTAEAKTTFAINVCKDTTTFYVRTNVDPAKISVEWQDATTSPWAKVVGVEQAGDDLLEVSLAATARAAYGYYTRRSGTLMIYAPELHLGTYLTVHQGCTARFANDFSTLKYGSSNPLDNDLETAWSSWTTSLKESLLTTPFGDGTVSYVYGGNGYARLGDDRGHGGSLTTKYVNELRLDSLLMVSFRAVAYNDGTMKDNNRLKVEILGGGVFRDFEDSEVKTMELEVPYLNPASKNFPDDMWNDAEYLLFVRSSDLNPVTGSTQIRLTSGSLTETGDNSRIYVTRMYIRRLVEDVDIDYFALNGGSGIDRILGLSSEREADDDIVND